MCREGRHHSSTPKLYDILVVQSTLPVIERRILSQSLSWIWAATSPWNRIRTTGSEITVPAQLHEVPSGGKYRLILLTPLWQQTASALGIQKAGIHKAPFHFPHWNLV